MQNWNQNQIIDINAVGLNTSNVQTIGNMPIGGYTLDSLQNAPLNDVNQLKSLLSIAKEDVDSLIDRLNKTNVNPVAIIDYGKPIIVGALTSISTDIQKSINNINIKLSTPVDNPIVTPKKSKISVEGVDFGNIILGLSSTLNCTSHILTTLSTRSAPCSPVLTCTPTFGSSCSPPLLEITTMGF